jgi:hypothetical protein
MYCAYIEVMKKRIFTALDENGGLVRLELYFWPSAFNVLETLYIFLK